MQSTGDGLREQVDPEEPLRAAFPATLHEGPRRIPAAVGITDRRLVCVTDDGASVSVARDAISEVRSRTRQTRSYRGLDHRLLLAAGAGLALLGTAGVLSVASAALVPLIALPTLAGLVAADYLRRDRTGVERATPEVNVGASGGTTVHAALDRAVPEAVRPAVADAVAAVDRLRERVDGAVEQVRAAVIDESGAGDGEPSEDGLDRWAILGGGALLVGALVVGGLLLAPVLLVGLSALSIVAGATLIDYGYRHRAEFEGVEVVSRRKTDVRIRTASGGTLEITGDAADRIDREVSRIAFAPASETRSDASLPP